MEFSERGADGKMLLYMLLGLILRGLRIPRTGVPSPHGSKRVFLVCFSKPMSSPPLESPSRSALTPLLCIESTPLSPSQRLRRWGTAASVKMWKDYGMSRRLQMLTNCLRTSVTCMCHLMSTPLKPANLEDGSRRTLELVHTSQSMTERSIRVCENT
ncbi:hypothetical protein SCLCIDRAFT_1056912 [Scleroderma citrinum Foug A]|uniref:Uncharacterized protein n=1 Tax=Scleroderma citrinum Foug A TaxID=1036808 RepID=A0A0C3A252_9AGAM|nr:hypothetical protein SCLCIDRAFT_1056912 [Scleroderma citrinum Foug A]